MKSNKQTLYEMDSRRYLNKKDMPKFQKYMRKICDTKSSLLRLVYRYLFSVEKKKHNISMTYTTQIGGGLFMSHPVNIIINHKAVIGENVNINNGVTIGQENRGKREGVPRIGNKVWIGANAVVVGNITIGDDVLIAPNTFVNFDVPPHSVVVNGSSVIKHVDDATYKYVERLYDE